jgi:alginate O-acetyltransferase complex protein AlgI
MQFVTFDFFVFFALVLLFAILFKQNRKIYTIYLFIVSLVFYYGFGATNFFILLVSVILNYVLLYFIAKEKIQVKRRRLLVIALVINVVFLVFFKYTNFLSNSLMSFATQVGIKGFVIDFEVLAPIGISFYTFRVISHIVDLYKGQVELPDFTSYATYITFFPQILSGPIERPLEFYQSLAKTKHATYRDSEVIVLILSGLIKKLEIASFLWEFTQGPFTSPQAFSSVDLIVAALAYSCMIYMDFSGYSDLSIAISKLLGFDVQANFKSPYRSIGLKEFWSRWHISLSSWLRDYVYIPLGGNRNGKARKYLNVFLTMLISGLWHGAGLTFIIWGALHGIGSVITHYISDFIIKGREVKSIILKFIGWLVTFAFVTFAWIFFNARSIDGAIIFIKGIFNSPISENVIINGRLIIVILVVVVFNFVGPQFITSIKNLIEELRLIPKFILVLLALYVIIRLGPDLVPPFIYFSF